jgi:hypothetical protein
MQQSPVVASGQMHPGFTPSINPQASSFPPQIPPGSGPSPSYPNGVASSSMQPPPSTPRPGSSHHGLAAQNLQNLTLQQRQQLFLMQQQRMGGMSTPQRPNPQGYPYQQQSPQHGSPTGFPDGSGEHQTTSGLPQPGPSVPGIAKSSRSPSVPIPSPVKGQGPFGPESYPQAIAMTTGQHLPLQQSQLSQMALQQSQVSNQQVPNQGWPMNMNSMAMGMNPAAFQLNTGSTPGQQPSGVPMYVNPNSLGIGTGQQPPNSIPGGWPSTQQMHSAGSPAPSTHDLTASRRASATPAPGTVQMAHPQFESNPFTQQWGS